MTRSPLLALALLLGLAPVDTGTARGDDAPPADERRLARDALEAKDFDAAIGHLDRALAATPGDADLLVDRAEAFDKRGDVARALADLTRAVELDPRNARAYAMRGKLRFKSDQAASLADCERALRLDPKNVEALRGRGHLRSLRPDFAGAADDFEALIALGQADRADRLVLGIVRLAQGDGPRAVAQGDAMLAADPADAEAVTLRGGASLIIGDAEQALLDAERAIRLAPGAEYANFLRYNALRQLGRGAELRRELDERLAILPDDPEGLRCRAWVRADAGDLAGAVADLDPVLRARPEDWQTILDRGRYAGMAGAHDRALADFAHVAEADPARSPAEFRAAGLRGLAWIRATCPDARLRDGARALKAANWARELDGRPSVASLQVLAAARAEAGDFAGALAALGEADRLGPAPPRPTRSSVVGMQLLVDFDPPPPRRADPGPPLGDRMRAAFRAGRPYRDAKGGPP